MWIPSSTSRCRCTSMRGDGIRSQVLSGRILSNTFARESVQANAELGLLVLPTLALPSIALPTLPSLPSLPPLPGLPALPTLARGAALRFLLTRISLIIPTFIGMTLLAFFLIRIVPGDPIETMAGERGIDPARHAALLKEYGLDRPVLVQYGIYIGKVLQGDLGKSIITQEPVLSEFATLFPATIELAVCAIIFALLIGIPAGIIAAVKRSLHLKSDAIAAQTSHV